MVCVPCIVIPFLLWFFHKYLRPIIMKVWPWSTQEKIQDAKTDGKVTNTKEKSNSETEKTHSNGVITNGHAVTAGDGDKKTN